MSDVTMKPTLSTSAASGGVTGALGIILIWGLSLVKVDVPSDVAMAFFVVLAPLVHYAAVRIGAEPTTPASAPSPQGGST